MRYPDDPRSWSDEDALVYHQAAGGRSGVVSLEALASSLIGSLSRNWLEATAELDRRGLLESGSFATIQRLHAFGELIGNTDMHFGNLAFSLDDTLPSRVTPAYDMLPMLWAPGSQGELIERQFAPPPPLPAMTEPWREAAGWAEDFWNRVTADVRLSQEFTRIAEDARAVLAHLRRHVG